MRSFRIIPPFVFASVKAKLGKFSNILYVSIRTVNHTFYFGQLLSLIVIYIVTLQGCQAVVQQDSCYFFMLNLSTLRAGHITVKYDKSNEKPVFRFRITARLPQSRYSHIFNATRCEHGRPFLLLNFTRYDYSYRLGQPLILTMQFLHLFVYNRSVSNRIFRMLSVVQHSRCSETSHFPLELVSTSSSGK